MKENRIIFGADGKGAPLRKRFLNEALERGKVSKTIWSDVGTTTNGTQHLKKLFNKAVFTNPKPEEFIQRIMELSTDKDDLILDFHLGSGTTAAVAHKMGRQYIGVEQMDYIEDIAVERLKKVIDAEQGGVSKMLDWQGGGSFVYCELLDNSKTLIDEIQKANKNNIHKIKNKIYKDERILPCTSTQELKAINEDFKNLTLENQKKALCAIVDKNKLYVNLSDIDDENYLIKQLDKEFTRSFYKI